MHRWLVYLASTPERLLRSAAAVLGGAVHETAEIVLPRFVKRSRLYEATAKNLLRVTVELVGAVERDAGPEEPEPDVGRLAARKATGNVVELGSIAAFGFSPLWLLAAAADVTRGTRVYLDAFVTELKRAGIVPQEAEFEGVDDLLEALEGTAGTSARLIDVPPLEVAALRRSLDELREDAGGLPSAAELAAVYRGLKATAGREQRSLLEVSVGMGIAFYNAARHVGREYVLDAYAEDLRPMRDEGFGAYARRVSRPYAAAVQGHFDPERSTLTERGIARLGRD